MKITVSLVLVFLFAFSVLAPLAIAETCGTDKSAVQKEAAQEDIGEPVNSICPVMEAAVEKDTAYKTVYNGKVIGFCCPACLDKFNENPEEYAAKVDAELTETKGEQE